MGQVGAAFASPCSNGYYRDTAQSNSLGDCKDVPDGQQGENGASAYVSTGATAAVDCVAGKYSTNGDGECQPCALGTYQDVAGKASCKDVAAGHVGRTSNAATTGLADSIHETGA